VSTDAATHQSIESPARLRLPRAVVVWSAFAAACTVAIGVLWAASPARHQGPSVERTPSAPAAGAIAGTSLVVAPRIMPRDAGVDRTRWKAIVIHDSRSPAGDLASIERRHLDAGLAGLGFHFVIGNGQGMDDGQVAVGYRWERQLPGAHASAEMRAPRTSRANSVALDAAALNRSAVAVCLVGNGERRPFTDLQLRELAAVVRALQAEFGIASADVFLRSELVPGASSGHFPVAEFRAALLP
jgi:hypothetical protein